MDSARCVSYRGSLLRQGSSSGFSRLFLSDSRLRGAVGGANASTVGRLERGTDIGVVLCSPGTYFGGESTRASGNALVDFCKRLQLDGKGLGVLSADSVIFCPLVGGTDGREDATSWVDIRLLAG